MGRVASASPKRYELKVLFGANWGKKPMRPLLPFKNGSKLHK
jgi:hypothetical protein